MAEYCPACMAENPDGAGRCYLCGGDIHVQNRAHQLPVMTILNGRYLTGRVLGEGGFGITYIGYDLMLKEKVAIKEYYPSGISNRYATYSLTVEASSEAGDEVLRKGRTRFLEEAQTMAKLRNVLNVVNVIDFFYANATAYIVMEYLDGQSMQGWLKEHGPEKDFDKLYAMLRPAMAGLAEVHKEGLIHRDISPSNLMLLKDGTVKLLDFGTAKEVNEDGEKSLSVVLKPGFAPEEQYRRHGEQGPWSDVYALCATVYKLMTGVTPEISMDRLMKDTLRRPSELGVKISPKQERVLLKGLAVRKEDRIKSVNELVEQLDAAGKQPAAHKKEEAEKKKAEKKAKQQAEKPKKPEKIEEPKKPETLHKPEEKKEPGTPKKKSRHLAALAGAAVLCLLCIMLFRPGQEPRGTAPTPTPAPKEPYVRTDSGAKEERIEPKGSPVVAVSAGLHHTVGLRKDGTVVAAGENKYGQCDVSDWTDIVAISVGNYHTVGLKSDGTVVATGSNDDGRCDVTDWTDIVAISAGDGHTVGLKSNGTVVATGDNEDGQCSISSWKDIVEISAGAFHTIGLKSDGTVVAKGARKNYYGQCDVSDWTDVVAIFAGKYDTVGLKLDGTVITRGRNNISWRNVAGWTDIVAISAGAYHTVGLKSDGTVVAAAWESDAECDVSGWTDIVAISAGENYTVGLKSDGTVVATGNNDYGQCDVEDWYTPSGAEKEAQTAPAELSARSPIVAISAGEYHTVGLRKDGTVVATGNDEDGQCDISDWTDIVKISAGYDYTVGLKSDGTVVATGNNDYGQCDVADWTDIVEVSTGGDHTVGLKSDGTTVAVGRDVSEEQDVSDWTDIVEISTEWNHTVGLKSDGRVVAVGNNAFCECNVSDWSNIAAISAGYSFTVGLKSDGTVVAIGRNEKALRVIETRRLDGPEDQFSVPDWKDIVAISAGLSHAVGLKADGTVVATGHNEEGQCEVSGWTDIVAISAGYDYTVGLKSDGTVVATGNNDYGQCDVEDW